MNQGGLGQLMQQGNLQHRSPMGGGSPFQPGQMAQRFLQPGQSPLMGGGQGPQMGIGQGMPPQMPSGAPSQLGYGGIIRPGQGSNMGFVPR